MICTDNEEFYQMMRMYRSHGMLRETTNEAWKASVQRKYPDLNPEFIFMVPGYNMRGTELNAVIGLNQLKRLDAGIEKRRENFLYFMERLNGDRFFKEFDMEGNSNYAFVLLLREDDPDYFRRLTEALQREKVEFRRGTAGGGNQARQPFMRKLYPDICPETYKNADKIHFYGLYTGNYPDLDKDDITGLARMIEQI